MQNNYWKIQSDTPLYPDIQWNRPEQKRLAGKLTVVGGNKNGFIACATAYDDALKAGVGECRVVLPDALRRIIPPSITTDSIFVPTNAAGSISKGALPTILDNALWADGLLLVGDAGRNSETAIVYESILNQYKGPLTITRDAIDLTKNVAKTVVDREQTLLVVSFAQLQKIFQSVYYPKVLSFSMQTVNLVETLHKFTLTYPCVITVLHNDNLLVAHSGQVTSTKWDNPVLIWRGTVAARAASYWLWSPKHPLEAVTTSLI